MDTKLNPLTSHRISAILQRTLEHFDFLSYLPREFISNTDNLSQRVSMEVLQMMNEQLELERKCGSLFIKRSTLTGLANKAKYNETQTEINQITSNLRENTQKLFRALADNPNIDENSKRLLQEKVLLQELIFQTLKDVNCGNYNSLKSYVDKELESKNKLTDIRERKKTNIDMIHKIEQQSQKDQIQFLRSMKEYQDQIDQLKIKIKDIQHKFKFDMVYAQKEAKSNIEGENLKSTLHENAELEEFRNIENDKSKDVAVSEVLSKFLANKHRELENMIEEWQKKYSNDINAITKKIQKLTENKESDLIRLNELRARQDKDKADELYLREKGKLMELTKIEKRNAELQREQSALKIQLAYRHHLLYKNSLEKVEPKKGKGKGKGKGKKK